MAERVSIHGCSARRCSHPAPTCGQTVDSCTLSARPIAQHTDCKSGGGQPQQLQACSARLAVSRR